MLDKKQLMKFCKPSRPIFSKPWSRGDWTYSTNGVVIVRIARHPDIEENKDAPDAEKLFKNSEQIPLIWMEIPNLPKPEMEKCDSCNGKGKYEDGGVCEDCDGKGRLEIIKTTEIKGVLFQNKYLRLLKELPNCQISPIEEKEPAWFKFDGGDGLIMPYRK